MAAPCILSKLSSITIAIVFVSVIDKVTCRPNFTIDYTNNTFIKDGNPFRYVSGSFHYTRVQPDQWPDRMMKLRYAGLNAVQTFVPWNFHESSPGVFTWDGAADLLQFLKLAQQNDLVVLLRLGPYMGGDWEFGGIPSWLFSENPNIRIRSSEPSFMHFVTLWFNELLTKIKPKLYSNGGPIIMVQIENEYGSSLGCDRQYMSALRDQVRAVLGSDVIIYTADQPVDNLLICGAVPGAYATVDFGVSFNASKAFKVQRDFAPHGPLVNSAFITGNLDHWGYNHSILDTSIFTKSLDVLLAYNASVNMYMFIGGTNYGFFNGAIHYPYQLVTTSYDYDAPISEAGDMTAKFKAIREVVGKYLPLPSSPKPYNSFKAPYPPLDMTFVSSLQDALPVLCPEGPVLAQYPLSMEQLKFYYGFVLYRFNLTQDYKEPTPLSTTGIRDSAMVMIDQVPIGLLQREGKTMVHITGKRGQTVDILVENQGRSSGLGMDILDNSKGLVANVSVGDETVRGWAMFPIHLEHIQNTTHRIAGPGSLAKPFHSVDGTLSTPSIYHGEFGIPMIQSPDDTFIDFRPWRKGQLIINNMNLGRYWPARGPQVTLFVPQPVLYNYPPANQVFLFEIEKAPCDTKCSLNFTDTPILDGPTSPDLH